MKKEEGRIPLGCGAKGNGRPVGAARGGPESSKKKESVLSMRQEVSKALKKKKWFQTWRGEGVRPPR